MEKSNLMTGMKTCTVVFYLLLLIAGIMVFSTTRSSSFDRLASAKLLRQIYANTLAYRLAEMEFVLSSERKKKDEYISRMESVLRQLQRDQKEFEPLVATGEEQAAYAAFNADWKTYLKESNATLALSKRELDQQAIAALAEHSRDLYENASRTLDTLVETNAKYPESWSDFTGVFFRANRLALTFLYICGVTVFLILVFTLYDRVKKRCS